MSIFASDTFSGGTAGDDLSTHAATLGGAWSNANAGNGAPYGNAVFSASGDLRCSVLGGVGTLYKLSGAPTGADYTATVGIRYYDSSGYGVAPAARIQTDSSCYFLTYDSGSAGYIVVRYNQSSLGFAVVGAAFAAAAPTGNTTLGLMVSGSGAAVTLTGLLNGSTLGSVSDTSASRLVSAGSVGLRFGSTSANGAGDHATTFAANDATSSGLAVSAALTAATPATLNLSAAAMGGSAPYAYQWHRSQLFGFTPGSTTLLPGATASTLSQAGLPAATTYYYLCVVTDSAGTPATTNSTQVQGTTLPTLAYNLWFAGNSLMIGAHSTAGNDPGSVALRQLGQAFANVPAAGATTPANVAIGGQSITLLANPNPGGYTRLIDTAAALDAHLSGTLANVLVVWELTNELTTPPATITAAQAVANLKAYCVARRAAGWTKIIVGTVLPRSYQPTIRADFELQRKAANDLLRQQWSTFADGIFDPGADTRIGLPGDELSATYYYQGASPDLAVHLVDAGYAIVADLIAQTVAQTLAVQPVAGPGGGPNPTTLTIHAANGTTPLVGFSCFVCSDASGQIPVTGVQETNSAGQVTFNLTTGVTYYLRGHGGGYQLGGTSVTPAISFVA